MKKIVCGVYIIISPSGRVYIGYSKDIFDRWSDYKCLDCKGQRKLYNSFLKYGVENHIFQIVQECEFEHLSRCERYWQEFYDVTGPKGLNCILTETDEKPRVYSEETRLKISLANIGKIVGEETRRKISLANKGSIVPEERKKRISEALIGRVFSDETLKKMSDRAKNISEETRQKMRIAQQNMTQETKDKISAAKKGVFLGKRGKLLSEETRKRIGDGHSKPIFQYDMEGNFIKEWKSATEAAKALGLKGSGSIINCLKETSKSARKFKWKYKLTKIEN